MSAQHFHSDVRNFTFQRLDRIKASDLGTDYIKAVDETARLIGYLKALLDESGQAILNKLCDSFNDQETAMQEYSYNYGLGDGIRFATKAFDCGENVTDHEMQTSQG